MLRNGNGLRLFRFLLGSGFRTFFFRSNRMRGFLFGCLLLRGLRGSGLFRLFFYGLYGFGFCLLFGLFFDDRELHEGRNGIALFLRLYRFRYNGRGCFFRRFRRICGAFFVGKRDLRLFRNRFIIGVFCYGRVRGVFRNDGRRFFRCGN